MLAQDVTADYLRGIDFELKRGATIDGVVVRELVTHLDGRGDVIELWSEPWLDQGVLRPQHVYQSATDVGVIKAWHLHQQHTDQFTCTRGKLQVVVADARAGSPTFGQV